MAPRFGNGDAATPTKFRCGYAGEWKHKSEFSDRQLQKWTSAKRRDYDNQINAGNLYMVCKEHANPVLKMINCHGFCGLRKAVHHFSKRQRNDPEPWCILCTERKLLEEPGNDNRHLPLPGDQICEAEIEGRLSALPNRDSHEELENAPDTESEESETEEYELSDIDGTDSSIQDDAAGGMKPKPTGWDRDVKLKKANNVANGDDNDDFVGSSISTVETPGGDSTGEAAMEMVAQLKAMGVNLSYERFNADKHFGTGATSSAGRPPASRSGLESGNMTPQMTGTTTSSRAGIESFSSNSEIESEVVRRPHNDYDPQGNRHNPVGASNNLSGRVPREHLDGVPSKSAAPSQGKWWRPDQRKYFPDAQKKGYTAMQAADTMETHQPFLYDSDESPDEM
ncbi:hypothetical protein F5Y15DRAFT_411933 [Xylariaceae sp. FL0016]|nr:hypothetical protein F5Y15DRAFT_411933 [Xylariaceae sp. FL0016]